MNQGDTTNVAVDWPKRAKKYNKDLNTAIAFVSIPSLLRLPHADVTYRVVSSPFIPLPPSIYKGCRGGNRICRSIPVGLVLNRASTPWGQAPLPIINRLIR